MHAFARVCPQSVSPTLSDSVLPTSLLSCGFHRVALALVLTLLLW